MLECSVLCYACHRSCKLHPTFDNYEVKACPFCASNLISVARYSTAPVHMPPMIIGSTAGSSTSNEAKKQEVRMQFPFTLEPKPLRFPTLGEERDPAL